MTAIPPAGSARTSHAAAPAATPGRDGVMTSSGAGAEQPQIVAVSHDASKASGLPAYELDHQTRFSDAQMGMLKLMADLAEAKRQGDWEKVSKLQEKLNATRAQVAKASPFEGTEILEA